MPDGLLRLEFDEQWTLQQLSDFLADLRSAYGAILNFENIGETRDDLFRHRRFLDFPGPVALIDSDLIRPRARATVDPSTWTANLALDGEPVLKSIHMASPGWLEALGKLLPWTIIADTIKWWHTRDLTKQKLAAEVQHANLENLLMANKVIKERVGLLKEVGVSKREIRALLTEQVAQPLLMLEPHVKGRTIDASVKALPAGKKQKTEEGGTVEVVDAEFQDRDDDPSSTR